MERTYGSHYTRGVVCALIGGALWGFSGSCAQLLFDTYGTDPVWMISVRMSLAGVVMMALAAALRPKRLLEPVRTPASAARIVAFAFLGLAFTQFTYLMAISKSNAGTATMLEYVGPVLIVLVVCVRDRRAPSVREVAAAGCVIAGTFFLATHGDPTQLVLSPDALIWGLLAAVSVVFYTLIPEPLMLRYDNIVVLAWALAIGGGVFALGQQPWAHDPGFDVWGWVALVGGLTILGTIAAFFFYFQGVKDAGGARAGMLASSEVVSATVFSAVWLGTVFTPMDLVGLLFIMSTVALLSTAEKKSIGDGKGSAHDRASRANR